MISLNRFLMAGFLRTNFPGLSKVFMSENRVVKVHSVHQFVNLNTFKKIHSVKNVVASGKRKFSSQIAKSSEATFEEDVQQDSKTDELNTDKIFEEIAAGDPERLKKLKIIEFEVAVLREEEHRVPDKITKNQWQELLELKSIGLRRKHLAFLRLKELKYLNELRRDARKRDFEQQRREELGFHYYGLSGHSMFLRIYEKVVHRIHCQRLLNPKLDIVVDCSYQDYMSAINLKLCAKQIAQCVNEVKLHKYPCRLTVCNLPEDSSLGKLMPLYCNLFYQNPFSQVHPESYLDLYPRERLLYLSPHAKNDLKNFNPDDVFIIGAYVDKGNSLKASLAKAKEHRLRVARLPIDEYLLWKKGTKSLPLNIVLNIIMDMAFFNDWRMALRHIPKRCLTESV